MKLKHQFPPCNLSQLPHGDVSHMQTTFNFC
uniref:Uncharacterized protein n=1 Tax=Anguilla anguilla TaxID=7936 RepID=A0A0E9XTZ7_ANGAN